MAIAAYHATTGELDSDSGPGCFAPTMPGATTKAGHCCAKPSRSPVTYRSWATPSTSASILNPGYPAPTSPVLGPGWRFSESPDHGLVPNANGSVTYVTPSGATPTFTGSPLVAPAGFDATLVREVDGTFTMTFPASADVLRFRADGLLSSETDRNANVVGVDYPA